LGLALRVSGALLLVGVMSLSLIFGYDVLTQCDYFKGRRIVIDGAHRLKRTEILRQTGIRAGANILAVNLPLVRKRLLAHPWVAEAQAQRQLPDTLILRIREQQPLAVVDLGRRFLINRDGQIFKALGKSDPRHLPLITGLDFGDFNPEGRPATRPFRAVMAVLQLGSMSKSVLPNAGIQRIAVDRDCGLTLLVADGRREIRLGFKNYAVKYRRLATILGYLERNGAASDFSWVDIQNINRVVVSPRGMSADAGAGREVRNVRKREYCRRS
jgi:cell division protein FtsQ